MTTTATTKKITGIFLLIALLHGCGLAPGMRMKENSGSNWFPDDQLQIGDQTLQVIPVTLQLIEQLAQQKKKPVVSLAGLQSRSDYQYRIGPRDVLQITVWDHPELTIPSGQFRNPAEAGQLVGEDGVLFYPFVGAIQVAGMTIAELRDLLTEKLSTYIQNPQLDVRVVDYRSKRIYVVGEVKHPGIITIDDVPPTVAEAINRSGGLTEAADKTGVKVTRGEDVYEINLLALYEAGDAGQNILLQDQDILYVRNLSHEQVFVLGEVNRPSSVVIPNGRLSLAHALAEVGGVDQDTADPSKIYIVRGSEQGNPQIYRLNAQYAYSMLLAERFELMAQDVVFVDTKGISSWNRVASQILPTARILEAADRVNE